MKEPAQEFPSEQEPFVEEDNSLRGFGGCGQYPDQYDEGYNQIYVGNLDFETTSEMLRGAFESVYSTVTEARMIEDPYTKKTKGFGFVKFASVDEFERSLQEMNGRNVLGRQIKVNRCQRLDEYSRLKRFHKKAYAG